MKNPLILQIYEPPHISTSRTGDPKQVPYREPKYIGHHSIKCGARTPNARPVFVHPSTTQLQVVDQALFWRRNAAIALSITLMSATQQNLSPDGKERSVSGTLSSVLRVIWWPTSRSQRSQSFCKRLSAGSNNVWKAWRKDHVGDLHVDIRIIWNVRINAHAAVLARSARHDGTPAGHVYEPYTVLCYKILQTAWHEWAQWTKGAVHPYFLRVLSVTQM